MRLRTNALALRVGAGAGKGKNIIVDCESGSHDDSLASEHQIGIKPVELATHLVRPMDQVLQVRLTELVQAAWQGDLLTAIALDRYVTACQLCQPHRSFHQMCRLSGHGPLAPKSRHYVAMRKIRGFTLIELMVSIAVLAILLGIAAPSFRSMTATSNLRGVSNELITTLAQARSEAIKRGGRVTVCMSADGVACIATGGWEQGWIMFTDDTRVGGSASIDAGETVLRVFPQSSSDIVINGNMTYVSYGADGLSKTMSGAFLAGTLQVCNTSTGIADTERARKLTINNAGRVLITKPSVASTCPAP